MNQSTVGAPSNGKSNLYFASEFIIVWEYFFIIYFCTEKVVVLPVTPQKEETTRKIMI